jgi:predicted nucleotidyltransferase
METMTLIRDINTDLKAVFQDYLGLYFFGSRSRKTHYDYSDYDMVFVFKTKPDWRKKDKIREIVYRKEVEYDVVIDGKYYSQEEIEGYQTPFLESVFKQGKFCAV